MCVPPIVTRLCARDKIVVSHVEYVSHSTWLEAVERTSTRPSRYVMRLRRFVEKGNFAKRPIRLTDFRKNGIMPIGV